MRKVFISLYLKCVALPLTLTTLTAIVSLAHAHSDNRQPDSTNERKVKKKKLIIKTCKIYRDFTYFMYNFFSFYLLLFNF